MDAITHAGRVARWGLVVLLAVVPAACTIPRGLAGQDLERIPGDAMALTFDGGSDAAAADEILDVLAARQAPATFFVTGDFVRSFPAVVRRMAEEHVVGNHTDTHADLTTLAPDLVRAEVRRAQHAIRRVTGHDPRPFFRFPYGARDPDLVALVNDLCYVPFRWTVDTLGWQGTDGGQSVGSVRARVLAAAGQGAVVLMHVGAHPVDGSTLDADALDGLITRLRADGHTLVSLAAVARPLDLVP
jgi:peptidoglycan/xylan/chitin deacetylase (PgdA/CDA1 family)